MGGYEYHLLSNCQLDCQLVPFESQQTCPHYQAAPDAHPLSVTTRSGKTSDTHRNGRMILCSASVDASIATHSDIYGTRHSNRKERYERLTLQRAAYGHDTRTGSTAPRSASTGAQRSICYGSEIGVERAPVRGNHTRGRRQLRLVPTLSRRLPSHPARKMVPPASIHRPPAAASL